ncbi:MAG: ATP-binding protein [Phascolarctobacterium sp.]
MRELSLHILDIAQNSIAAGAKHIQIVVNENENGFFVFKITDDGCGMSEKMLQKVWILYYYTQDAKNRNGNSVYGYGHPAMWRTLGYYLKIRRGYVLKGIFR